MNQDRVNGAIDEVVGSAKRHIGEWTGDTKTEVEGAVQQIKGKVESAVGKLKDAVHDAHDNLTASAETNEEIEREHREAVPGADRPLL